MGFFYIYPSKKFVLLPKNKRRVSFYSHKVVKIINLGKLFVINITFKWIVKELSPKIENKKRMAERMGMKRSTIVQLSLWVSTKKIIGKCEQYHMVDELLKDI